LCASLITLFPGEEPRAREAREFLEQGCALNPEGRESLAELASVLERNTAPLARPTLELPAPEYWDEDTVVPFQRAHFKIISRLGRGGIGQTFKVVEVDARSDEIFGSYVAKLIHHQAMARSRCVPIAGARLHRSPAPFRHPRNCPRVAGKPLRRPDEMGRRDALVGPDRRARLACRGVGRNQPARPLVALVA
jgi:hypothetical protein